VLGRSEYHEVGKKWVLRLGYDRFKIEAAIDIPDVYGVSPDGKALVFGVPSGNDVDVQTVDLDSGVRGASFDPGKSFNDIVIDPLTGRILATIHTREKREYSFYNPDDQAHWDKVLRAFPGANVDLESWSADRSRIVVHVSGGQDGDCFMLVDLNTKRADAIGYAYEGITANDTAQVTAISYQAQDKLRIPAYLTLPRGREPKDLPLIVLPHGGPHSRDEPGFDWWPQALASRGYAVLQPQFRGSDGWGNAFLAAGYGEFGRKMQTDLSDGVRDLAAKGIIDPKRVCIVGASYGGYAALGGATLDTGVYRCAVSVAGLSDLRSFLTQMKNDFQNVSVRFWDRFLGIDQGKDDILDAISPIKHVDRISIPILLIHGKDDTVVPFDQSAMMVDAMKKAGKPVQFVQLTGEDHWLSRSETRLQMLKATVDFLEANNPPN
jgi:dipeptidyl aminopeptidase/acylaminoacyl peptidase